MTQTASVPASSALRMVVITAAVLAVIQIGMGALVMSGVSGIKAIHGYVGYLLLLALIAAAVLAFLWRRAGGAGGAFMHAVGLALLVIVQIGLGEMDLKWVHVIVGLITCAGIISMIAVVNKKADPAQAA